MTVEVYLPMSRSCHIVQYRQCEQELWLVPSVEIFSVRDIDARVAHSQLSLIIIQTFVCSNNCLEFGTTIGSFL